MVSDSLAPSTFRRFLEMRVQCPLCGAHEIDYEFVLQRTAYSQCRACTLFFAGPRSEYAPAPAIVDASLEAALAELGRASERYLGRIGTSLIVSAAANRTIASRRACAASELIAGDTYDTIFIHGALERDEDPLALLESLKAHLAPGGCFVILTPSITSPLARSQRSNWNALSSRARYYFSPDSLQLLATRCGLGDFVSYANPYDLVDTPNELVKTWFKSNIALICRPSTSSKPGLLSVIFPVYNEADLVEASLQRILAKDIPGIDIEIVIVESNSTDGSREIVERYEHHPRVRLIREDRPRGKGYAVRTGLKHATGEVVLFQDADLEYDIEDYDVLIAPLFALRRTFVLGSRHNARGEGWKIRHFADRPLVALITNIAHLFLLTMFNTLYRQKLRDPFTMYKVFRRDCLYGLTFECNRFDFDFEICIKLMRKGYQPVEIPINYTSRSFSEGKKVSFFRDPPTWIRAMIHLRRVKLYTDLSI
jgi:SAM-dependent methyltransferase